MKKVDYNLTIFFALICLYISGQFLIGTYNPDDKRFVYGAPADEDFLYYGAIINTVLDQFPPENPAFAGTKLTQPFLQYYPAAILSKAVGPYNAIRILNVIYLIIFGFVLKRFFPDKYGLPLLILFAGSTYSTYINALGIDLISRGFTHAPFFILLTLALYGKLMRVRLISLFVAALLNGYLMIMVLPFLAVWSIYKKERQSLYLLGAGILGVAVASLFVMSEAVEKPVYFVIAESFKFAPIEILKHAAPVIILALLYRHTQWYILLAISILIGAFIHYNPFFPVFMVYFSGALILAEGKAVFDISPKISHFLLAAMLACFIILTYHKFNPNNKNYFPRHDSRVQSAVDWVRNNTESDATFAAISADREDLALLMQYRPVYLGPIELVAHLGLNFRPRYDLITRLYRTGQIPEGVDYIFYGPVERKYFPGLSLPNQPVFKDNNVTIYKAH